MKADPGSTAEHYDSNH